MGAEAAVRIRDGVGVPAAGGEGAGHGCLRRAVTEQGPSPSCWFAAACFAIEVENMIYVAACFATAVQNMMLIL